MQIAIDPDVKARSTDTNLSEGMEAAARAADSYRLPQTVYRGPNSGGWWHTNPFASSLQNSEVHCTILPANYFL